MHVPVRHTYTVSLQYNGLCSVCEITATTRLAKFLYFHKVIQNRMHQTFSSFELLPHFDVLLLDPSMNATLVGCKFHLLCPIGIGGCKLRQHFIRHLGDISCFVQTDLCGLLGRILTIKTERVNYNKNTVYTLFISIEMSPKQVDESNNQLTDGFPCRVGKLVDFIVHDGHGHEVSN